MSKGLLFWILMVLWLVFGCYGSYVWDASNLFFCSYLIGILSDSQCSSDMKNNTKLLIRGIRRMREEQHNLGKSRSRQRVELKQMRKNYSATGTRNYLKAH